jgi:hypothetical protein
VYLSYRHEIRLVRGRKFLDSKTPRAKRAKDAKFRYLFLSLCGLCVLCARHSDFWLATPPRCALGGEPSKLNQAHYPHKTMKNRFY